MVVQTHWDETARTYRLDFAQSTAPTPGQTEKEPMLLPVRLGLTSLAGGPVPAGSDRVTTDGVFLLDRAADSLVFEDVGERPVPSLFRNFSAPAKVRIDLGDDDLLALLEHDADPFNRWQSTQTVALRFIVRSASGGGDAAAGPAVARLAAALRSFLATEAGRDPAFAAVVLTLPSETEIAQEIGIDVDPDAIRSALVGAKRGIGGALAEMLRGLRSDLGDDRAYSPDAASAGRRSLRNTALDLLAAADPLSGGDEAARQFVSSSNMTDRLAALAVLAQIAGEKREDAFTAFYDRYADEPLVLDKWFALQATIPEADTLDRVRGLMNHAAFAFSNPNRVRALIGSFALGNPTQFHRPDGAGYSFLADSVLALNASNPQVAARLLTAFGTWRAMEPGRRRHAHANLSRIAGSSGLSPDVSDIAARSLDGG